MEVSRWPAIVLAVAMTGSLSACNPAQRAREAKENVDSGNAAACVMERSTIEKAVQAYTLLNPDTTVTEAAMVAGGYLHEASVLMDITANGTVIPAVGSVCA